MMKRSFFFVVACAILFSLQARADFVIDGTTYAVDTLVHRQVGPGMVNTIVRIPGYPLNVYVMEVKLDRPASEALEQIDSRKYLVPYTLDGRCLTKIGMSFSTVGRNVTEWLVG